ncbi:MAG: glycyl-radical enzyme activating protein, partial [bacterium]|nr:glycyl-radical enzyme activating protein [bacterium]
DKADLFLYDLKLVDSTEHENYTRVSNGEILENLETLSQENKNVVIRFPLVPGITDTENNVTAVAEFVSRLKGIRDIDILPYHNSAGEKYRRLKIENKMAGVRPPTPGRLLEVKDKFQAYGLNVREVN